MKQIHPNLAQAATLAAIVSLVIVAGCRNQSGTNMNPFLAPDRVPPPATRAILPGQAQPYYPGDPLPVMQSATQPQTPPSVASSMNGLAWNAPNGTAATSPSANDASESRALAFSNEPTVAVPSDDSDLRFPLPIAPEPEPITPIASPAAPQQAVQLASAPTVQTVMPASYAEPVVDEPISPSNLSFAETGEPVASGPWRSPAIAASNVPGAYGVPPMFPAVMPVVPQPNTIDVRLRAVPSPPPQPVEPSAPRIRLPGYAPQPWSNSGAVMQSPFGNVVQTVAIGPLPPPPYDPAINLAAAPGTISGGDGFRPRSSMR